ncbi:hypothetical protein ASPWEDRAFT_357263 [Aspergillus wentii DTO 134E9]|uniref:Uncharacterized protein n=1 Tax=Aspergillus wentii DTO 134E9 TaxID=1073089 RepID=A0A1L9RW45_ASPWE|nr:uncharacterized protein ASPWEDRAFT_357263 [Aspergillus wentii DTO 134E9]OJJ39145.1 hypothetical protein ASPWEDRAFT_357263 [Aspergillus wentii DTO 134E9]
MEWDGKAMSFFQVQGSIRIRFGRWIMGGWMEFWCLLSCFFSFQPHHRLDLVYGWVMISRPEWVGLSWLLVLVIYTDYL